jgi:hypothetical protein
VAWRSPRSRTRSDVEGFRRALADEQGALHHEHRTFVQLLMLL